MNAATLVVLALAGLVTAAAAQTDAGQAEPDAAAEPIIDRIDGLADRLASLGPEYPEAYFLLGEEVAADAQGDGDLDLARELYALAFELAGPDGSAPSPSLRASICIALAQITRGERDQRWLRSISRSLDPRYATTDWAGATEPTVSMATAYDAATAVGAVRSGDGVLAKNLLEEPGVGALLDRYGGLITGTGPARMHAPLQEEAARWPCPECRNKRVSTTRPNGEPVHHICRTCDGSPGWRLSHEGLIGTLRFESWVLRGVQRSWSAQIAADSGPPLRDPDPAELAPTFGVSADRPYFRDGEWAAQP